MKAVRFSVLALALCSLLPGACAHKRKAAAGPAAQPPPPPPPPVAVAPKGKQKRQNQGVNLPVNLLPPGTQTTYNSARVNGPFIAITFDDGPHPTQTPRLLDILAARNVKATFYVLGQNAQRYPAILRRMVAEGHEIANHSWNHPKLSSLSDAAVRDQLNRTHKAIIDATGAIPKTYRPPYGAITARQKEWIKSEFGYPTILWSVDPNDWQRPGPSVVTSRIINGTRSGAIILAHDIHPPTIDAMPATIDGLLARGYRFVTVSQLIGLSSLNAPAPLAVNRMYTPGSF